MAKAAAWNGSDGEGRKLGEQTGLDMGKEKYLIQQIFYIILVWDSSPFRTRRDQNFSFLTKNPGT